MSLISSKADNSSRSSLTPNGSSPKLSEASTPDVNRRGGILTSSEGLLKYDDLIDLLTCGHCGQFCGTPIFQCRKGHVYCKECKTNKKLTHCKQCKQTFVDTPNLLLEKVIALIALPCCFKSTGCSEFLFVDKKREHETFCQFRPVSCQFTQNGCPEELAYKDIHFHHKNCGWNPSKQTKKAN